MSGAHDADDPVGMALISAACIRMKLWEVLEGESAHAGKPGFVWSFLDLASEHHEAMATLIALRLPGSAHALLRPLYEAVVRACWVYYSDRTDEEIADLFYNEAIKPRERIPKLPTVTSMVQEVLARAQREHLSQLHTKAWQAMCSFVHGGIAQIARRLCRRTASQRFTDLENALLLRTATWLLLIVGRLAASTSELQPDVKTGMVDQLMADFAVSWKQDRFTSAVVLLFSGSTPK